MAWDTLQHKGKLFENGDIGDGAFCLRFLKVVELGTEILIHRHLTIDESFVVLRGKVRCTTYNDDGSVIKYLVLCAYERLYGVDLPKGVWHKLESLESGSVCLSAKRDHLFLTTKREYYKGDNGDSHF